MDPPAPTDAQPAATRSDGGSELPPAAVLLPAQRRGSFPDGRRRSRVGDAPLPAQQAAAALTEQHAGKPTTVLQHSETPAAASGVSTLAGVAAAQVASDPAFDVAAGAEADAGAAAVAAEAIAQAAPQLTPVRTAAPPASAAPPPPLRPQLSLRSAAQLRTFRQASGALAAAAHGGATLAASDFDGEVCSPLCRRGAAPRAAAAAISQAAAAASGTGAGGGDADCGGLLAVRVHRCSAPLEAGAAVVTPVVRLHLVSAATGEYLRLPGIGALAAAAGGDAAGGGGGGGGGGPTLLLQGDQQAQVRAMVGLPAAASYVCRTPLRCQPRCC